MKVGVTRSTRLHRRWIEQGAAFAAEVEGGLSADAALDREAALSDAGLRERVRKTEKLPVPSNSLLADAMEEHGVKGEVIDVFDMTRYPHPERCRVTKTGRIAGDVRTVFGQLIEIGGQCLAVTPGLCIEPPKQTGLGKYI